MRKPSKKALALERRLAKLDAVPERTPAFVVNLRKNPELYRLLAHYKRTHGYTWERIFLVGVANTIARQGDDPELVGMIADYLLKKGVL